MITPQEFFSLLSDETRLRCLLLLHTKKELCVCELSQVLGSIQPKISRHLALLRKSGLVLDERRGQWIYYRLNERMHEWMKQVLSTVLEDLKNRDPYQSDYIKVSSARSNLSCSS